MCGGSSQISRESGGFLAVTNYAETTGSVLSRRHGHMTTHAIARNFPPLPRGRVTTTTGDIFRRYFRT